MIFADLFPFTFPSPTFAFLSISPLSLSPFVAVFCFWMDW